MDTNERKHTGYICPPAMCAMRYINDARYLEGDEDYNAPKKRTLQNPREPNVEYCLNRRFKRNKHFLSHEAIGVYAIKDIVENEELYLCYGDKYRFPQDTSSEKDENSSDEDSEVPLLSTKRHTIEPPQIPVPGKTMEPAKTMEPSKTVVPSITTPDDPDSDDDAFDC